MAKKKTNDQYISEAKTIWGDWFDYSQTQYSTANDPVNITCREHGYTFSQNASSHLKKMNGCPKCQFTMKSNKRLFTNDEFIKRAKTIWGDRFDYSKVQYTGSKDNVTLVCNQHNIEFECMGNSVLHGSTLCPECLGNLKRNVTTQQFISEAKAIWGDSFDYGKTIYTNNKSKVTIICNKHNVEFNQIASCHLNHQNGCPQCNSKNMNTEKFIAKANAKWGDRFDYSKVQYTKSCNKIILICRKHNCEFTQTANNHMQMKQGCPECRRIRKS